MTKFFKKVSKHDVYEKAILDVFSNIKKRVTPSEVAEYLKISPHTVKTRVDGFIRKGVLDCKNEGRKQYCKIKEKKPINQ